MGKELYFILERRFDNALKLLENVCTSEDICATLDRTGNSGSISYQHYSTIHHNITCFRRFR